MIVAFDTETTGLPAWGLPSDHPSQPHIVELAAVLYDDDGTERDYYHTLIQPNGWLIPPEAVRIHGITTSEAEAHGIHLEVALDDFFSFMNVASARVAHNQSFDERMVRIALLRLGEPEFLAMAEEWRTRPKPYCTQVLGTPVARLPATAAMRATRRYRCKTCTLGELHKHLFGGPAEGQEHRALTDARACGRCFFELKRLGNVT